MSLIQEALAKTQNKVVPQAKTAPVRPQAEPWRRPLGRLQDLDHEIEKQISEVRQKPVSAAKKSYFSVSVFFALGVVLAFAFLYWFNMRSAAPTQLPESVPSVVDIPKNRFVSKPELALPGAAKVAEMTPAQKVQSQFALKGIVWDVAKPYALLNGEILREGDPVNHDVIVSKIEKERVLLDYHGEKIELRIRL